MRPVTIRGRGHPNVRALHPKTIELVADAELGLGGTCIVAVGADLDPAGLTGLDGPVTLTLRVGDISDHVTGVANPRYDASTGRLVVRRSRHRSPDTLVVAADKGSADLDRALVAALARPDATVDVTIEPADDTTTRTSTDVVGADLRAGQTIATTVATTLAGEHVPVTFAGALPRATTARRRALASAADILTVWEVRPHDIAAVAADLGERVVAVVTDPATPDERVTSDAADADTRRAKTAFVVARTVADATTDDRLLAALADAGVDTRTLQQALVTATGASRREAYERIVRTRAR